MKYKKALTFSYDDGTIQDRRLIEILNRYGLKATFNLNSQLLDQYKEFGYRDKVIKHQRIGMEEVSRLYKGHEVAAHTLEHKFLPDCTKEEIIHQVEEDRRCLSKLVGYEVVGLAYPGGGQNHNDNVAKIISNNTGICYARTIKDTYSFEKQENLYQFNPSVHNVMELDKLFELGEKFLDETCSYPQIFFVWGHSYEFDIHDTWEAFESFCKMMSGHKDIFYGTNREVLLP